MVNGVHLSIRVVDETGSYREKPLFLNKFLSRVLENILLMSRKW